MKNILAAAAIALLCILTPAQEAPPAKPETGENTPAKQAPVKTGDGSKTATLDPAKIESGIRQNDFLRKPIGTEQSTSVDLKKLEAAMNVTPPEPTEPALNKIEKNDKSFHWKPALVQSGLFLAIQHGFRMTEEKTRSELDGPFFSDWKDSVKNLKGWDDGGKVFTNYVAHPMQGAITSRIFLNNSGKARLVEFGGSKIYWESRMKAMAWSALWSLQFEIGPLSESSLGNVGQKLHANGKSRLTYLDLVVTPTFGTGLAIAEDIIDKYVVARWIERKIGNRPLRNILSGLVTPTTSFANLLRGHSPWYRERLQR